MSEAELDSRERQYPTGGDPDAWCECGHHELNHANYADMSHACNQTGCDCRQYAPAAPEGVQETPAGTTLSGRSREDWHKHIDFLFEIAFEGEDIPYNALLAWTGKPTEVEFAWAKEQIADLKAQEALLPLRLLEIQERLNKATATEVGWEARRNGTSCSIFGGGRWIAQTLIGKTDTRNASNDAAFIAGAPSDVRWLIGKVKELRSKLSALPVAEPKDIGGSDALIDWPKDDGKFEDRLKKGIAAMKPEEPLPELTARLNLKDFEHKIAIDRAGLITDLSMIGVYLVDGKWQNQAAKRVRELEEKLTAGGAS